MQANFSYQVVVISSSILLILKPKPSFCRWGTLGPGSLSNFPEIVQLGGDRVGLSSCCCPQSACPWETLYLDPCSDHLHLFSQKVHPEELSEAPSTCEALQDVRHTAEGVCLPGLQDGASEEGLRSSEERPQVRTGCTAFCKWTPWPLACLPLPVCP